MAGVSRGSGRRAVGRELRALGRREGMLINTGYYPVRSIQLPFVSYGAGAAIAYVVSTFC